MRGYTILQWLTFFMLYCILGWCFESSYCSLKSGHLQNRGFCHGPWIPLYGVGSCLLVFFAHGHEGHLLYLFLLGFSWLHLLFCFYRMGIDGDFFNAGGA